MIKKIITKIPHNWRKGQFIFNFLEWLRKKGIDTNQNKKLADSFNVSDDDFDKYLKEYINKLELDNNDNWENIFDTFYDDNKTGGSSRWLVSPDTVKQFIDGLLKY